MSRSKAQSRKGIDPDLIAGWLQQAVGLHQQGKLNEARGFYLKVLKEQPDNADALHLCGMVAYQQGKLEEAEKRISRAIASDPSQVTFLTNLGVVKKARGKLEDACRLYLQALELQPAHAEAHNNLANVYQGQNLIEKAVYHYEQALLCNPGYVDALFNMGAIHYRAGAVMEAETYLQRALAVNPAHVDTLNQMGCVRMAQGDSRKAIELFEHSIRLRPINADAYYHMGIALQSQQKLQESAKAFQKALEYIDSSRAREHVSASAQHLLAAVTGAASHQAPGVYVEHLFDSYSKTFDAHLTESLEYHSPELIYDAVNEVSTSGVFQRMLDLGCGTGLVGSVFRQSVTYIEGIDLSRKMLDVAAEKRVYDHLAKADLADYLGRANEPFSLIIAADVFVYIGDLRQVFSGVARRLGEHGLFAFSVEGADSEEVFLLRPSGRYAHSQEYISVLAAEAGLRILLVKDANIRKERDEWIPGCVYVLGPAPRDSE